MLLQPLGRGLSDAADLSCLAASDHPEAATAVAVAGIVAAYVSYRARDRVAEAGHGTLWAVCALLVMAIACVGLLSLVPLGCVTDRTYLTLVGAAAPWVLAALVVRSGVAPPPPSFDELGGP